MTEQTIRETVSRYEVRMLNERRPQNRTVVLAFYAEVPGCLVEGPNREATLRELDQMIVPFLQGVLADGGAIPAPRRDGAPQTTVVIATGIRVTPPPTVTPSPNEGVSETGRPVGELTLIGAAA